MEGFLVGIGVLLLVVSVHTNEDDREDFKVLYDQTFNLTCESSHFNLSALLPNDEPQYFFWVTPNGEYLGTGKGAKPENSRAMIGGTSGNLGKYLMIKNTDDPDFGVYICMIQTIGGKYMLAVRKGINVDGPYYGDLLAKYRNNIIIGVCSGGGLLVVCIVGCLIYHLRYRTDEEDDDEEIINGKINYTYENTFMDDEKASTSSDHSANIVSDKRPESEIDTKL